MLYTIVHFTLIGTATWPDVGALAHGDVAHKFSLLDQNLPQFCLDRLSNYLMMFHSFFLFLNSILFNLLCIMYANEYIIH